MEKGHRDDRYATRRPEYIDLEPGQWPSRTCYAEIKEDGKLVSVVVENGKAQVWNRHGIFVEEIEVERCGRCVLLGEMLTGTQRSKRDPRYGKIVIFDCVEHFLFNCETGRQEDRIDVAMRQVGAMYNDRFEMVRRFTDFDEAWQTVIDEDLEGLVFKDINGRFGDPWHRMKQVHDVDYCALGYVKNGRGVITGIKAGAYVSGSLKSVCRVPVYGAIRDQINGNSDGYMLKVFKARGNDIMDSGALRGAKFLEWHADKVYSDMEVK